MVCIPDLSPVNRLLGFSCTIGCSWMSCCSGVRFSGDLRPVLAVAVLLFLLNSPMLSGL